jgi:H+/Cl- antiporter ClcA
MVATSLVKRFAPDAKGSGIPQVLLAIEKAKNEPEAEHTWRTKLVSLRTAGVKVLSSTVGILGGASIGREGPTVQIAASGFAWIARRARRFSPSIDLQSYLIAGAGAGVAAAFNTPLAGITFAMEELAEGAFGPYRQRVMLAVIIAGITAQALLGNYLYFGHPRVNVPNLIIVPAAILIGVVGGIFGGAFARLLAFPALTRLPKAWRVRALVCGIVCAMIGLLTNGATAGSGYEVTAQALAAPGVEDASIIFPLLKLTTTVLSYLSGMAGGIFSPSLSIGAAFGIAIAKLVHFVNFRACALIGMVAFFSGAVQAPLTAVIIVMEMTDEHILIIPFMIAAFLAHGIGRLLMPKPLYRYLAERHQEG